MLKAKVFSAGLLLIAAMASARLLDLVGMLLVARMVATENFGIVAICLITYQFVSVITQINITDAMIQREGLVEEDFDRAFSLNVLRGLIIYAVLLIASFPLAAMIESPAVVPVLAVMGLTQVVMAFRSPKLVLFSKRVEPLKPSLSELIGKICGFVVLAVIAFATRSYWAIVIGMLAGQVVSLILTYYFAPYRPRFRLSGTGWLLSFSIWFNFNSIVVALSSQFDRFYVGYALDQSALAIYTIATSIGTQLIWSLAAPLMNALFAGISGIKSDLKRIRRAYLLGQQTIFAIIMPIGAGLALLAQPITYILLGEEWIEAGAIISIIAPATAFQMMTVGAQSLALANGRPDMLFRRSFLLLIFNIPLTILAIGLYEMAGAAWVRSVVTIIYVLLCLEMARRLVGTSILEQLVNCIRPAIAVGVMAGAVIALLNAGIFVDLNDPNLIGLAIISAIGAMVYGLVLLVLWLLSGRPAGVEEFALETAGRFLKKAS